MRKRFSVFVLAILAACHRLTPFEQKFAEEAEEALDSDPFVDTGTDVVPFCLRWGIRVGSSLQPDVDSAVFVAIDPANGGTYRFLASPLAGLGWRVAASHDRMWYWWEMMDTTGGEVAQQWLFYYAAHSAAGTVLNEGHLLAAGDFGIVPDDQVLDASPPFTSAAVFFGSGDDILLAVVRPECLDDGVDAFRREVTIDTSTLFPP